MLRLKTAVNLQLTFQIAKSTKKLTKVEYLRSRRIQLPWPVYSYLRGQRIGWAVAHKKTQ